MFTQSPKNISSAVIFLEKHCEGEYNIKNNRIIYNRNLRIPDIDGISNMNLSAIHVEGIVMVSSTKSFKLDYLPFAEGYYGLTPDRVICEKRTNIKKFEERGFSKQFCKDYKKMQFANFCNRVKNRFRTFVGVSVVK